jgi:SanA protein
MNIRESIAKAGEILKVNAKKLLFLFLLLLFLITCFSVWSYRYTGEKTASYVFSDPEKVPAMKVGMVLGTSRYLSGGDVNPFFSNRIQAAKLLFFSGKIRYLIVSGDNRFFSYNEPREMRRELIRAGIPDTCIFLDFAGFRTLDSVVRGGKVFGLKKFIIISQDFHNKRAVYIGRHFGLDVVAFNARMPGGHMAWRVKLREYLARAAMMTDLYVFNQQPYFLGKEKLPAGSYE